MRIRFYISVLNAFILASCADPGPEVSEGGECALAADCAEPLVAPCAGCIPLAVTLCDHGLCTERGEDALDVVADVMLARGEVTDNTQSLVYVLASQNGGRSEMRCQSVFSSSGELVEGLNVFASGYKNVSGGSFHQDLALGRSPSVPLLIIVWGTDGVGGQGNQTGTGCLEVAAATVEDEELLLNVE